MTEASQFISLRLFLNHRIETDNGVGVLIDEIIYHYCSSLMHSYQGENSGGKIKASTIMVLKQCTFSIAVIKTSVL